MSDLEASTWLLGVDSDERTEDAKDDIQISHPAFLRSRQTSGAPFHRYWLGVVVFAILVVNNVSWYAVFRYALDNQKPRETSNSMKTHTNYCETIDAEHFKVS